MCRCSYTDKAPRDVTAAGSVVGEEMATLLLGRSMKQRTGSQQEQTGVSTLPVVALQFCGSALARPGDTWTAPAPCVPSCASGQISADGDDEVPSRVLLCWRLMRWRARSKRRRPCAQRQACREVSRSCHELVLSVEMMENNRDGRLRWEHFNALVAW